MSGFLSNIAGLFGRVWVTLLLLATGVLAQTFADLPDGVGKDTYAIVLVNQEYDRELTYLSSAQGNLENAVSLFKGLGLPDAQIFVHRDLDRIGLEDAIFDLGSQIPKGARVLLYFHGIGVHLLDTQANHAVMSGLRVRPNSEPFLIGRRIERASISLQTLVDDILRTPAQEVFVIYDACAVKPLNGNRSAKYWEVVSRTPCVPASISGADVLYGAEELEQEDFMAALLETLRQQPQVPLSQLEDALRSELTTTYEAEDISASLFVPNPDADETVTRCLAPSHEAGQRLCPEPEQEQAVASEGEVAQDETEANDSVAVVETPEPSATDDAISATQVNAASEGTIVITAPTSDSESASSLSAGQLQGAWYAAKEANTCQGYMDFIRAHPKSAFGLKANFALRKLCSAEDRAAFETEMAAAPKEAPKEPEEVNEAPAVETDLAEAAEDTSSDEIVISAPQVEQAPAPAGDVFKAWREARGAGSCEGFLQFQSDFEKSAFAIRAKTQIARLCSDEDIAAFEIDTQEDTDAASQDTVKADPEVTDDAAPKTEESATTDAPSLADTEVKTEERDEEIAEAETPEAPAGRADAFALLVVNDTYEDTVIPAIATQGDLELMQQMARALDIPQAQVKLLRNLGKTNLETAVVTFSRSLPPNADLLVYYAGHSLSFAEGGQAMILPSDFSLPRSGLAALNRSGLRGRAINMRDFSDYLRSGHPRRVTMIFNACGPAPLPDDLAAEQLDFLNAASCANAPVFGMTLLSPVSPEQVTGTEEPSLFMQELAKVVSTNPSMRFLEIGRTLAWAVPAKAERDGRAQDPVLVPDPRLAADAILADCFAPQQVEGAEHCTDLEGKPPEPPVVEPPAEIVKQSPEEPKEPEVQSPRAAWLTARQDDSCVAYLKFKQEYPKSVFRIRAEQRIKSLCSEEDIALAAKAPTLEDPVDTTSVVQTETTPSPEPEDPETTEEDTAASEPEIPTSEEESAGEEEVIAESVPAFCAPDLNADGTRGLTREGVRRVQVVLNSLGCNVGVADGGWGPNSRRGYARFDKEHSDSWPESPVCDTVAKLEALPKVRVCPLVCGANSKLVNGRCVSTTPKPAPKPQQPAATASTPTAPAPAPTPEPAPAPKPVKKCKPLEKLNARGKCVPKGGVFSFN